MKLQLLQDTDRRECANPACGGKGDIPCDCLTKVGTPRKYCRWTGSAWIRSHPCPTCCTDFYPNP